MPHGAEAVIDTEGENEHVLNVFISVVVALFYVLMIGGVPDQASVVCAHQIIIACIANLARTLADNGTSYASLHCVRNMPESPEPEQTIVSAGFSLQPVS